MWATQERAKQTKGRSHPCKRQGYKNAASNKVTRAKERTTFSPISCTDLPFLQTFPFLAGEKPLVTPSVLRFVPEPQNTVVITPNPLLPLTLHDIRLLPGPFFLHYPTASLRSTRPSAFSPLVTILALHHTHRPSSQGPDRTLPSSSLPQRQRNRMSSPTASNGSASTASSNAQSQYQDRLISKRNRESFQTPRPNLQARKKS